MARHFRFTFLCNTEERQAIAKLALHLQRSHSDAVRYVVLEAAKQLAEATANTPAKVTIKNQEEKNVTA